MLAHNFEILDIRFFTLFDIFHEHYILLYHIIIEIEKVIIVYIQGPYWATLTADYWKDNIEKFLWLKWWRILFQFRLNCQMRDSVLSLNRDYLYIIFKI